mmetsp:Transcript_62238/g.167016  ORF Transcript_62238/g.167016 Transcript_62238/m.167016 type:complete len:120 (-) Transcript_62238:169-528(-)
MPSKPPTTYSWFPSTGAKEMSYHKGPEVQTLSCSFVKGTSACQVNAGLPTILCRIKDLDCFQGFGIGIFTIHSNFIVWIPATKYPDLIFQNAGGKMSSRIHHLVHGLPAVRSYQMTFSA